MTDLPKWLNAIADNPDDNRPDLTPAGATHTTQPQPTHPDPLTRCRASEPCSACQVRLGSSRPPTGQPAPKRDTPRPRTDANTARTEALTDVADMIRRDLNAHPDVIMLDVAIVNHYLNAAQNIAEERDHLIDQIQAITDDESIARGITQARDLIRQETGITLGERVLTSAVIAAIWAALNRPTP